MVRPHQIDCRLDAVAGRQLIGVQLVELCGQAFGLAAGIAEDDGAAVFEHLLQDARIDARPDAALVWRCRSRTGGAAHGAGDHRAHLAHVVDRHHHVDHQRLADTRVDDRDRTSLAVGAVPAEEVGDLFERSLRGRQTEPLRRPACDVLEPFERQHEMRAPLGGSHGVDLVDDDRVDVDQRAANLGGEHEVQALGRRDEQIDGASGQCLAIFGRRVAGAHGY